jgi:FkbM family methyltransferase
LKERPLFTLSRAIITRLLGVLKNKIGFPIKGEVFWGERMFFPLPDSLGIYQWGFINGEAEIKLTRYFIKNIKPNSVFFDVGAHCGFYSCLALSLIDDLGQVHAFEPTPQTFRLLRKNLPKRDNIFVNNLGVWDSETEINFFNFGTRFASFNSYLGETPDVLVNNLSQGTKNTIKVKTTTLDDYVVKNNLARVDFVKIDVERAEPFVLRGAKDTIAKFHPTLSVEILGENWGKSDDHSIVLLKSYGYSLFLLDQEVNLTPFDENNKDFIYDNLICIYGKR